MRGWGLLRGSLGLGGGFLVLRGSLRGAPPIRPLPPRSAMAHLVFEADLHGLLKLDTPIPNAPLARWQRKAKESGAPGPGAEAGLSPMKPANRLPSGSKTPGRTPGERRWEGCWGAAGWSWGLPARLGLGHGPRGRSRLAGWAEPRGGAGISRAP